MTTVFIGGSRKINRLTEAVRARLNNIVERHIPVLVGDANGADKAVQAYLRDRGYENVLVFCTGATCRNNLGGWTTNQISPPTNNRKKDRRFFALKDAAMTQVATHGFMLWDGQSLGTLVNLVRLMKAGKTSVLYVAPSQQFVEIRGDGHYETLVSYCSRELIEQALHEVQSEGPINTQDASIYLS